MINTLQLRRCFRVVILTFLAAGLAGCSPAKDESGKEAAVPPISGEQLDTIRQQVRESDLFKTAKPIWTTVNWVTDTRIVVHSRIDGLEDPALGDSFCERASEFIFADLLPGQSFDLYLVGAKGIHACN
jgi:hypothetical protein